MSTAVNGSDGGRTTPQPPAKSNGTFSNGGEATDDVKATQQHIKNLETELKHARDALSGWHFSIDMYSSAAFDTRWMTSRLTRFIYAERESRDVHHKIVDLLFSCVIDFWTTCALSMLSK